MHGQGMENVHSCDVYLMCSFIHSFVVSVIQATVAFTVLKYCVSISRKCVLL